MIKFKFFQWVINPLNIIVFKKIKEVQLRTADKKTADTLLPKAVT